MGNIITDLTAETCMLRDRIDALEAELGRMVRHTEKLCFEISSPTKLIAHDKQVGADAIEKMLTYYENYGEDPDTEDMRQYTKQLRGE